MKFRRSHGVVGVVTRIFEGIFLVESPNRRGPRHFDSDSVDLEASEGSIGVS